MLLRRSWLAAQGILPWDAMSYWPWVINVIAVLSGARLEVPRPVCTQRARTRDIENMSRGHASLVRSVWPRGSSYSLPDSNEQWLRLSFAVVQQLANRFGAAMPWIAAAGFQHAQRQASEIERLKRELRRSNLRLARGAGDEFEPSRETGNDRQVSMARGP